MAHRYCARKGTVAALAFAALLLSGAPAAHAYPIAPQPLWQQVEEAELIVLAEVAAVGTRVTSDDDWNTHVATLEVLEAWKGEAASRLLVTFPGGLTCPAPPRYLQGERVVAFLGRDEAGGLQTVGLSYGTLYPSDEYVDDVRDMVSKAVRLQRRRDVARADRLAWTVEAAARPGTRWHGLYELHPRGDEIHSFYDRGTDRPLAKAALAAQHLDLLARAFVAHPTTNQTAVMMLGVLARWRSDALDAAAAGVVEAVLGLEEPPWWTRDLLAVTLVRFGDRRAEERLAGLEALTEPCTPASVAAVRETWAEAKRELGIPEVLPVPIREPERPGVGGRTPS